MMIGGKMSNKNFQKKLKTSEKKLNWLNILGLQIINVLKFHLEQAR